MLRGQPNVAKKKKEMKQETRAVKIKRNRVQLSDAERRGRFANDALCGALQRKAEGPGTGYFHLTNMHSLPAQREKHSANCHRDIPCVTFLPYFQRRFADGWGRQAAYPGTAGTQAGTEVGGARPLGHWVKYCCSRVGGGERRRLG